MAVNFNISLPYIQMKSLFVQTNKLGKTIVIKCFKQSGGYTLGFKPPDELFEQIYDQLRSLRLTISSLPPLGVSHQMEEEVFSCMLVLSLSFLYQ